MTPPSLSVAGKVIPLPAAACRDLAYEAVTRRHAMQDVAEFAAVLAAAAEIRPRLILEIGCHEGGTLWAWRQVTDPPPAVWGITLQTAGGMGAGQGDTYGAALLIGDSHDPGVLAWFTDQAGPGSRPVDVLHIDGDHTLEGAACDFAAYAPLVRPGGLVVIHDVCTPGLGVARLWDLITGATDRAVTICWTDDPPIGSGLLIME